MNIMIRKLYHKIFPSYEVRLEKIIGDCESLLDVGCGNSSPIKSFSKRLYTVGVDIFEPSIKKSKKLGIHNQYYKMDVLDIGERFEPFSFDCVFASDVLEHVSKEDGIRLIEMMEKIARKIVIIQTPNGFLPQYEYENNPWQKHLSGWNTEEMKERGYVVTGSAGWRIFGRIAFIISFWPRRSKIPSHYGTQKTMFVNLGRLWKIISDTSQVFVKNRPEKAFQILCVKSTGE